MDNDLHVVPFSCFDFLEQWWRRTFGCCSTSGKTLWLQRFWSGHTKSTSLAVLSWAVKKWIEFWIPVLLLCSFFSYSIAFFLVFLEDVTVCIWISYFIKSSKQKTAYSYILEGRILRTHCYIAISYGRIS